MTATKEFGTKSIDKSRHQFLRETQPWSKHPRHITETTFALICERRTHNKDFLYCSKLIRNSSLQACFNAWSDCKSKAKWSDIRGFTSHRMYRKYCVAYSSMARLSPSIKSYLHLERSAHYASSVEAIDAAMASGDPTTVHRCIRQAIGKLGVPANSHVLNDHGHISTTPSETQLYF